MREHMRRLTLFIVLALIALLSVAAAAATAGPVLPAPLVHTLEEEAEEETETEEEEEFCEEEPEECEEVEDAEMSGKAKRSRATHECMVRSLSGHAIADSENRKLKVTLGYTTYEPLAATIEIRIGSVRIGSVRRHLGISGVLRINEKLGKATVKRVIILVRTSAAPRRCEKLQTEKIPVSKSSR